MGEKNEDEGKDKYHYQRMIKKRVWEGNKNKWNIKGKEN